MNKFSYKYLFISFISFVFLSSSCKLFYLLQRSRFEFVANGLWLSWSRRGQGGGDAGEMRKYGIPAITSSRNFVIKVDTFRHIVISAIGVAVDLMLIIHELCVDVTFDRMKEEFDWLWGFTLVLFFCTKHSTDYRLD